jgi:hypothetical protein
VPRRLHLALVLVQERDRPDQGLVLSESGMRAIEIVLRSGFSAVTYRCGKMPIRAGGVKPYPC